MPVPTPASLGEVLQAARDVLVAQGVFTEPQAFLGLDPDDIILGPTSPIAVVTFGNFDQRDESIHAEVDTTDTPTMQGELIVSMWIRIALDAQGRDTYFLTTNSSNVKGASEKLRQVMVALNNQTLTNSDGETIVWRTLNYLGFRNRGKWGQDKNWRRIDVRFDVVFNQKSEADVPDVAHAILWGSQQQPLLYAPEGVLVYG